MRGKVKKIKDDDVPYESLVEGVSSAHSWIKSNTMLRPTKLSRKKGDGSDDEDDDEADILILLTSRIPNTKGNEVRFVNPFLVIRARFWTSPFLDSSLDPFVDFCSVFGVYSFRGGCV